MFPLYIRDTVFVFVTFVLYKNVRDILLQTTVDILQFCDKCWVHFLVGRVLRSFYNYKNMTHTAEILERRIPAIFLLAVLFS